jgi:methylenetetrahydrofolate reductase (NADPH)
MKIRNRLNPSNPCFSFEFFPPKTEEGLKNLLHTLDELEPLAPGFVSVTYGAGGSTRGQTVDLVKAIRARGIEAMAHVTCVGHARAELALLLDQLAAAKVENVLALRGDPPAGNRTFVPAPDGFAHAAELVGFIRERDDPFCLGGACYPEGHVETLSREEDLRHLKAKVDAGLDFLITQIFFDNAFYFDFLERARRLGVNVPIVPGIMPITNFEQLARFTRMCGATVPMRLQLALERVRHDAQAVIQLGVAHAVLQCTELLRRGVPGIHFYTLNRSPASRMIVTALRAQDG